MCYYYVRDKCVGSKYPKNVPFNLGSKIACVQVYEVLLQRTTLVFTAQTQLTKHQGDLAFLSSVAGINLVVCIPAYVGLNLAGAFQVGFRDVPSCLQQVQVSHSCSAYVLA